MSVGQDAFAAALLAPGLAVPHGLSDSEGRRAGKRFDVYRNNVVAGLTAALETAFPVIRKLVGTSNFAVLAGAFIHRHPPRTPLMMLYGADLAGFLETWPPAATLGYLPDIARLEQALREAYHAADAEPIDPARLAGLSPDALMSARLGLAPALRVIRSRWPVHAIWRYNSEPGSPKPPPEPQDVAVLRRNYDPEPVLLLPGGAELIAALRSGASLGEATEAAFSASPRFDPAPVLNLLIGSGSITALETS